MKFNIRRARHSDIDNLLDLRIALLHEVGNLKSEEEVEKVRNDNREYYEENLSSGTYVAFVAESQGLIVGTCGLIMIHRPPTSRHNSGRDAYITSVYTIPNYRGKGIATALLNDSIEFAKSNHVGRIILNSSADGKSVYQKRGFVLRRSAMELVLGE